jgi:hypothetical protein
VHSSRAAIEVRPAEIGGQSQNFHPSCVPETPQGDRADTRQMAGRTARCWRKRPGPDCSEAVASTPRRGIPGLGLSLTGAARKPARCCVVLRFDSPFRQASYEVPGSRKSLSSVATLMASGSAAAGEAEWSRPGA